MSFSDVKKDHFCMQIFQSVPIDCDLLILGEMGISNTSSATAISCAIFDEDVEKMTGIGTIIKSAIRFLILYYKQSKIAENIVGTAKNIVTLILDHCLIS